MLSLLNKQTQDKEYYWAILIEDGWISSAVWKIENEKVEVLTSAEASRSQTSLLEAIDTSLSVCIQNLPEKVEEPEKTVFGVPSNWISDGEIKSENLSELKKICQDLSLVPSGFVILAEAISYFIKSEKGAPFTGITLGVTDQSFEISIFNSGKSLGSTDVYRSISPAEDVIEGLSRLSSEIEDFPTNIIVYNQKESELEDIKNSLNEADWSALGEKKFIHTPKIDIFEPSKKILAIALAGGVEIGRVGQVVDLTKLGPDSNEEDSSLDKDTNNFSHPDEDTASDLGFKIEDKESKINLKFPKLNIKKPDLNLKIPSLNLGKKTFMIGIAVFLSVLLVGFLSWWFLPKATITVVVSPKNLEDSINILLDKDIASNEISIEVGGEKTKSTTGTKVVGEKASGSVEVRNNTAFPVNLAEGTILISSSDLKFTLTKSASISASILAGTYGKETLEVEAYAIGSEYNLSKDEVFKVSNYPKAEVAAVAIDNFSGGTSRDISAVSQTDRDELLEELSDELIEKAKTDLEAKLGENDFLIESSIKSNPETENYSNKAGDEATSLKLSLNLKIVAKIVSRQNLIDLAKNNLDSKIPSGFVLKDDQIKFDFIFEETDRSEVNLKVNANLLPNVNTDEISKSVAGRYPLIAEEYLKNIVPGYVRTEFRSKFLPGKLGTLPHVPKNIKVLVASER